MSSLKRIFIPNKKLSLNTVIKLDTGDYNYLRNVMRKKVNDTIMLFNQEYGIWIAKITSFANKRVETKIIKSHHSHIENESNNYVNLSNTCSNKINEDTNSHDQEKIEKEIATTSKIEKLGIIFSPVKAESIQFFISKAIELGMDELKITIMNRTVQRSFNYEKVEQYVKSAAQQSLNTNIPHISLFESLQSSLFSESNYHTILIVLMAPSSPKNLSNIIEAESDNDSIEHYYTSISDFKSNISELIKGINIGIRLIIVIGPEGGFAVEELKYMKYIGKKRDIYYLTIGSNVMKSETAFLSACTILNIISGRW